MTKKLAGALDHHRNVDTPVRQPFSTEHVVVRFDDLGPLDALKLQIRIEVNRYRGTRVWAGAVYVVAPNSSVHWFGLRGYWDDQDDVAIDGDFSEGDVIPHAESRPIVFFGTRALWDAIPEAERAAR